MVAHSIAELAGIVAVGVGLWWIHPPLCLIVLGVFVASLSVLVGLPKRGK